MKMPKLRNFCMRFLKSSFLFMCLFICAVEFGIGDWMSALGWMTALCGWIAFYGEKFYYNELLKLYHEHLDHCEKQSNEYRSKVEQYKEALAAARAKTKAVAFDVENVDVGDILRIGRDWQKSDTWRGATHDTAKLLCDTIEMLRDKLDKE